MPARCRDRAGQRERCGIPAPSEGAVPSLKVASIAHDAGAVTSSAAIPPQSGRSSARVFALSSMASATRGAPSDPYVLARIYRRVTRVPGNGELPAVPVRDVHGAVQMLQGRIWALHIQEVTALQDKFSDFIRGGGHLVAVLDPQFVVLARLGLIAKQHCRPSEILIQRGAHGRDAEYPVSGRLLSYPLLPAPLLLGVIVPFTSRSRSCARAIAPSSFSISASVLRQLPIKRSRPIPRGCCLGPNPGGRVRGHPNANLRPAACGGKGPFLPVGDSQGLQRYGDVDELAG